MLVKKVPRKPSGKEMRPHGTLVIFRASDRGAMVVRYGDMLNDRPVLFQMKDRAAGNRAPRLRNMSRRRRILVSRQSNTARIDDHLFADGCRTRKMTVGA
jgi:hypothetical protein